MTYLPVSMDFISGRWNVRPETVRRRLNRWGVKPVGKIDRRPVYALDSIRIVEVEMLSKTKGQFQMPWSMELKRRAR